MYYVKGGIYADDFKTIEKEEKYGPFDTYEIALAEWRRRTFTPLIDNAFHKLWIFHDEQKEINGAEILRRFTRPDND